MDLRITPLRLAFAITMFALAVRLNGLGLRPLWLDEAYSAWFSERSWHVLWTQVPTYEPHPPFYYSLLKLWRSLFGGTGSALRCLSVLLGIAAVPLAIAASIELERQRPTGRPLLRAGVAAFLVACSPMLVLLGQEARPYPLLIFAFALATLGAVRLMREFAELEPGSWTSWSMLTGGTTLCLWAHDLGLLYALCLALALAPAWIEKPVRSDRLWRGIAVILVIGLLYLPCLLMLIDRAGDWKGGGWLSWTPAMTLQLLSLYLVPVEVLTVGSAVAALVLFLLVKRAAQAGFVRGGWDVDRALLLLWWGPPLLAIIISQLAIPIFLPRTLAATLVPAYLSIAGALARIQSRRERLIFTAALVITLTPTAVQIGLRPSTEPWDEVSTYLQSHTRPGDQLWLYPNDSGLPLREAHFGGAMRGIPGDYPAVTFKGPIRAGSPAVVSLTHAQAEAVASDPSVRSVPIVWLVTRQSALFDPDNDLPIALARVRRAGSLHQWGYITVRPYYRR